MKNDSRNLSRRTLLSKGVAAIAASSIISIEALAAPDSANPAATINKTAIALPPGVPVTTTETQTLTNKTIPSRFNTLGTDYVNIREYPVPSETTDIADITSQLNQAIDDLSRPGSYGGQILIPHGVWHSDGGHDIKNSISIEGVGFNTNPGFYGTEIKLNSKSGFAYMFKINSITDRKGRLDDRQNCSLKNLAINLQDAPAAAGLLMTNEGGGKSIYLTSVENVGFYGGEYGIKVNSDAVEFECILNRFERLSFIACRTAFYCNTINGGYSFDTCYFSLPTMDAADGSGGTAFDCPTIGNLSVEHCLFVGNQRNPPNIPPSDGSTILKTVGEYNNISFSDCQDEGIEYTYQNAENFFDNVPLVFRNCLVQSKFKYTASGSVIFDSCRLNITNGSARVTDTRDAYARVYLKGLNYIFWQIEPHTVKTLDDFVNPFSQIIYEAKEIGLPVITPTGITGDRTINASRGTVNIARGESNIRVYNNSITPESLVFAQLRSYDSGGARIINVYCEYGLFTINFDKTAANELSIGFKVEG
ncbi:MAG TPA: hypothetical protein VGC76_01710 [Pyrinomonadaceae bacterium]|jgi:hypothetical protein